MHDKQVLALLSYLQIVKIAIITMQWSASAFIPFPTKIIALEVHNDEIIINHNIHHEALSWACQHFCTASPQM